MLEILAWIAGGLAALRYAVGLPALVRYLRRARVARIPKGPTPPLSVLLPVRADTPGLGENVESVLRQNYPEFEVVIVSEGAPPEPVRAAVERVGDVPVRDAPTHDLRLVTPDDVRADPLYLRDAANAFAEAPAFAWPPVFFGTRTAWARLLGLGANTDGFLMWLLGPGVLARRAVRRHTPRASLSRVLGLARRARAAAPLRYALSLAAAFAPALLLAAPLWWCVALLAGVRVLVAIGIDLRFVWDRSLVRALPLLPLLWILEPLVLLAGCIGRAGAGPLGDRANLLD